MKWRWGRRRRAAKKRKRERSSSHRPTTEAGSLTFETLEQRVLLSANPWDISNGDLPASHTSGQAVFQHVGETLDFLTRGAPSFGPHGSHALSFSAQLIDDSGASASDHLTNDGSVKGQIQNNIGFASVRGGLDQTQQSNFTTLIPYVRPNGQFTITQSALQALAGGPLADGAHTLHLLAVDQVGGSAKFDLSFVLDRTPPALSAGLVDLTTSPRVIREVSI